MKNYYSKIFIISLSISDIFIYQIHQFPLFSNKFSNVVY